MFLTNKYLFVLPFYLQSVPVYIQKILQKRVQWHREAGLENRKYDAGIRQAYHVAPSIRKMLALTSPTGSVHSVGIVRWQTRATEIVFVFLFFAH
jgi:hypothetical protein